jgi:hypothetical protein
MRADYRWRSHIGVAQNSQVPPAADLVDPRRLDRLWPGGLADGIGERQQVITARPKTRWIGRDPNDLPTARCDESL